MYRIVIIIIFLIASEAGAQDRYLQFTTSFIQYLGAAPAFNESYYPAQDEFVEIAKNLKIYDWRLFDSIEGLSEQEYFDRYLKRETKLRRKAKKLKIDWASIDSITAEHKSQLVEIKEGVGTMQFVPCIQAKIMSGKKKFLLTMQMVYTIGDRLTIQDFELNKLK